MAITVIMVCVEIMSGQRDLKTDQVAAFYHLYMKNTTDFRIPMEQMLLLQSGGLLARLDKVYYTLIDPSYDKSDNKNSPILTSENMKLGVDDFQKFQTLGYLKKGTELFTLQALHGYCRNNTNSKVLYFHAKGSYSISGVNENLRSVLNKFTLHTSCIDALEKYDTCGWRLSPVPFPHYSGNFWWARCSYINSLIPPLQMKIGSPLEKSSLAAMIEHFKRQSYYDPNKKGFWAQPKPQVIGTLGFHRLFAEAWLGTGQYLDAADCCPVPQFNSEYLFGYGGLREMLTMAKTLSLSEIQAKLVCTTAATNKSAAAFQSSFDTYLQAHPNANIMAMIARNLLWTGNFPFSLVQLREKYGDVVDSSSSRQLHYPNDMQ